MPKNTINWSYVCNIITLDLFLGDINFFTLSRTDFDSTTSAKKMKTP